MAEKYDIEQFSPSGGRVVAEDGTVHNIVGLLQGGESAVKTANKCDIEQFSPTGGRVVAEDGTVHNIVDLIQSGGNGNGNGGGSNPLWTTGIKYGAFNAHAQTVEITFDDEKRLTLEGNGNFTVYDDASGTWRMTAWLKALFGTVSVQTKNVFDTTSLLLDNDTGYSAGRAALTTVQLFYHRDRSIYDIYVISWANNSNTSTTEPGSGTRLENVVFHIKRIV